MTPRRAVLSAAVDRLREAGVASPEHDAAELLAHVLGTTRSRLPLVDTVPDEALGEYDALIARRAASSWRLISMSPLLAGHNLATRSSWRWRSAMASSSWPVSSRASAR